MEATPAAVARADARPGPAGVALPLAYRPDVDGLRAIAILSVVVFHAGATWLPGGHIGVDVFFVISGYLITRIILNDIRQGRFSIARFYVRRARRILPALFVVLAVTWLLGAWMLTPAERAGLGKSMAATAGFVSNITFWREVGYFDVAAERKPLLHTWSLAVEEQFYLAWPLLLAFALRRRVDLRWLLVAMIGLSFAFSVFALLRRPDAAFYLLPARAWELLIGAVLALRLLPLATGARARNLLALAGLALLAFGLLGLDRDSPFPGWNALYPTLGTAMLIHAGEGGQHVVSRHLLSWKPVVFIGLVSYSFYLWHWPLLSIARITQRGELPVDIAAALVLLAALLSVATWRYVELPFRARRGQAGPGPTLTRYALASTVVGAIGFATYAAGGFVGFTPEAVERAEAARGDANPLSGTCLRWQAERGPLPGEKCVTEGERFPRRAVLWGDSHADALAPGVAAFAHGQGRALYQLTMAACPPLSGVRVVGEVGHAGSCADFVEQVLRYVTTAPVVETVVLSARWTVYAEGSRFGIDDSGPRTFLVDSVDRTPSRETSMRVLARSLEATIVRLLAAGKKVVIIGQVPELGINVPDCLARNHLPFGGTRVCSTPSEIVSERLGGVSRTLERVAAAHPQVRIVCPDRFLCRGGQCAGTADGKVLYRDDDHLSATGARVLAQHFEAARCSAEAR